MKKTVTKINKPASLRMQGTQQTSAAVRAALGLSTLMLAPAGAMAAETAGNVQQLSTVKVEDTAIDPNPNAEPGVPYKARTSGDERHTRPLAETPQSISVITRSAIDDSGYTDLKQILDAQPGITLGTGENGNAFGDRYIIRGQEARSDVFVDGLRDPGMTTRESFAIEQLEISRGPNSSFAGRGTAGGAINAITKQPTTAYNFTRFATGFGTDKHTRLTTDVNYSFGERFALRGNALYGYEEVPDRAPADRERKGLALSGLYAPSDNTQLIIDYYGLRTEDRPDLGGYLTGTVPNRVPVQNVPVYSQTNDFAESEVDTATVRFNHSFAPGLQLISRTRYGTTNNGYATTGASASVRYDGTTGTALPANTTAVDNGHTGWQDVQYFAHQTNLRWDRELAGMKHEFIFGVEYTDHKVVSAAGSGGTGFVITGSAPFNCRNAGNPPVVVGANNAYCFAPEGSLAVDPKTVTGRVYGQRNLKQQDWQADTWALAVMDTVDLTDELSLFVGLRSDHFDLSLRRFSQTTGLETANYGYSDTLLNGHLGVTYQLTPRGVIYVSGASAQDINGGEPDAGTNSGYGGLVVYDGQAAGADPESSLNFELGTKWNLLDEQLLLTAAAFQITKSDVMEGAGYDAVGTFNSGKNRVRGVEFTLVGMITPKLSGQIGATVMKSKVLESATPANVGHELSNFANESFVAQLRYAFTEDFSVGGALKYEGDKGGGQPDTGASYSGDQFAQPVPSYTVFDLFAEYRVNKNLDLHLNVNNVADKDYYTAVYRSGAFLYKGDARTVRLTLNYEL